MPLVNKINICNSFCNDHNTKERPMKDELLLHLHEQYAINNNANLGSFITILVALIAIFAVYGHLYIHSLNEASLKFEFLKSFSNGPEYYFNTLVLTGIVTNIILTIMLHLCLYQGSHQRYEQFTIFAIRAKNMDLNHSEPIFPKNYCPFNKGCLGIIQGLFGEFVRVFIWIVIIIVISLFYKASFVLNINYGSVEMILFYLSVIVFFIVFVFDMNVICKHYTELENFFNYLKKYCNENKSF